MNILQLLASSNFIPLNKTLIKEFGLEETIIFSELVSEFEYWTNNNGIDDEGYFYSTIENLEEKTTLSDHKQRKALKKLQEMKVLDVKICGLPAKRYIKINEEQVIKLFQNKFFKNLTTSSLNFKHQEVKKMNGNNNINNKNIDKNINSYINAPSDLENHSMPAIELTLNDKSLYPIYENMIDEWKELYPNVDVMQELRKMKGWLNANPTKRKTKKGILRFINSWLTREQDKGCTHPKQETFNITKFDI